MTIRFIHAGVVLSAFLPSLASADAHEAPDYAAYGLTAPEVDGAGLIEQTDCSQVQRFNNLWHAGCAPILNVERASRLYRADGWGLTGGPNSLQFLPQQMAIDELVYDAFSIWCCTEPTMRRSIEAPESETIVQVSFEF